MNHFTHSLYKIKNDRKDEGVVVCRQLVLNVLRQRQEICLKAINIALDHCLILLRDVA